MKSCRKDSGAMNVKVPEPLFSFLRFGLRTLASNDTLIRAGSRCMVLALLTPDDLKLGIG